MGKKKLTTRNMGLTKKELMFAHYPFNYQTVTDIYQKTPESILRNN